MILPQAIGNVTCAGMVPSESTDAGSVVAEGTPCIMNTRRSRRRVRPDGTGRRRAGRGLILDQIVAHQARILMPQHVAVIKEQAGIVLEPEQSALFRSRTPPAPVRRGVAGPHPSTRDKRGAGGCSRPASFRLSRWGSPRRRVQSWSRLDSIATVQTALNYPTTRSARSAASSRCFSPNETSVSTPLT